MSGFTGRGGDSGGRNSGGRNTGGGRGGGRDSGGRDGGGRDGGGRGRGPPAGRDGGGLSGRNRHMGEVASIQALVTAAGMSERDILAVVNPPIADRDRLNLLDATYSLEQAYKPTSKMLPAHAAWRNTPKIGKTLNPETQVVRSNHFRIDVKDFKSSISQYVMHLYRYDRKDVEATEDCAQTEDSRLTTQLIISLRDNHPEWNIGTGVGFTYNGRAIVYTSSPLPLTGDRDGSPSHSEIIFIKQVDGSNSKSKFRISLTLTDRVILPDPTVAAWSQVSDVAVLMALDTPLLSFARWGIVEDLPDWFTVGSKAYRANGRSLPLSPAYNAQRGYYAGLKTCMAGLVLVSDMSVTCFLAGGPVIDVMWHCMGYRSLEEMLDESKGKGINKMRLDKLAEMLKGAKVRVTHLGHFRKFKSMGPAANSQGSLFQYLDKKITVADYFVIVSKVAGSIYKKALPQGKLKYPTLPCINVGSESKPIFIPPELLDIPGGQCRSKVCTPEMTAKLITEAAVRPDERMRFIMDGSGAAGAEGSIVTVLRNDPTAKAFGLHNISKEPIATSAILLPQAKLRYGGGVIVDPLLNGTWLMDGKKFSHPPQGAANIGYGILVVGGRGPPSVGDLEPVNEFKVSLEKDASLLGLKLVAMGGILACGSRHDSINEKLTMMRNARIVVCVLIDDCYGEVKLIADKLGLATQCCKMRKLQKLPRGYSQNIMLKVNTKLGGINHTLVSRLASGRLPAGAPAVYQDPPASIAWVFDKPCMLVGIDVSHGETFTSQESVAAVVASMDGKAGQYAAHISAQTARAEMVSSLEDAMVSLLTTFRQKNNDRMPSTIIVYRDGVGEGQFTQVTTIELNAIRGAVQLMGYTAEAVKIVIVICQKSHHTRFVYEEPTPGGRTYINPCPGLCIDASGGVNSIASARLNEFYLNSHAAIQGTAKPCKYTLVHDELGFKTCELELLTYWLTYTYCRANKAVSLASPAYYAHWASKRGKYLCAAGATSEDLLAISKMWGDASKPSTMFFV